MQHVQQLHGTLRGLDRIDHEQYHRKHGFELNDDGTPAVVITYDDTNRTFTITPVGTTFTFWVDGLQFVKTGAQTSSAHPNTTAVSSTIIHTSTFFTLITLIENYLLC